MSTIFGENMKNKKKKSLMALFSIIIASLIALSVPATLGDTAQPLIIASTASASISVGGEEINGYQPSDIVDTNDGKEIDTAATTAKLEQTVIKLVKILMPILMIACVAIIIYNAARNLMRDEKDRVKMGDLIKNMFVQFFFILFAWIIVEGIVFLVSGGETILFSTMLS